MDIKQAVIKRHSVRRYIDKPIEKELREKLNQFANALSIESGLHFDIVYDEPEAFTGPLAHYGKFENCSNYIVITGPKKMEESVGYFGEKLVIYAQMLGLNTCWVALTYKRGKAQINVRKNEKFYIIISIGYGRNRGLPRKTKPMEKLCQVEGEMPEWFKNGMDFAMRAPTAMNQQKFLITLKNTYDVSIKALFGPCSKIDLGIVKYHFELGAERKINWK